MTRTAVLVDFGGVLTTSVLQAFEDFGVSVGAVQGLLLKLLSNDAVCRKLLVEIEELRTGGVPIALVSNAFGRDCYAGFDLSALADVVVISSEVGIRKPSRRIYAIACERLGVTPEQAIMIDDLQQNLDGATRLGIAGVLHTEAADTRKQLDERFGIRVAPKETR